METTVEMGAIARVRGEYLERFNLSQRLEHIAIMASFTVLAFTGLPQKYAGAGWAQWLIINMGGIESIRLVHRIASFMFTASALYHLGTVFASVVRDRFRPSILFTLQDFKDTFAMFRYDLGVSDSHPEFDRYDFRQKFEYWGIVFGGIVMLTSGYILMFPVFFTRLLPGQTIPVAKVFHSYEGLMAFLVIIFWHLYGAHLEPGKFPGDTSIFTGKISRERMIKEHPLEYARLIVGVALAKEETPEVGTSPAVEMEAAGKGQPIVPEIEAENAEGSPAQAVHAVRPDL